MKVILVNERLGHTRTYVIKGWLKGVLSLCLLGAPVALGYLGYQLSLQQAGPGEAASYDAAVHHSLRGAPKPAEVQLSGGDAGVTATVAVMTGEDRPAAATDSTTFMVDLQAPAAVPLPTAGQSPRPQFRHGRSVDPATYQRRVYS